MWVRRGKKRKLPFSACGLWRCKHPCKYVTGKYQPDEMAVEELFFNSNAKTAISVGQARGVILLAGAHKHIPIYEYTPLQIKQGIVGYGRADKKQIQYMVQTMLNMRETPKPDDAADALAIAICHGQSNKNLMP